MITSHARSSRSVRAVLAVVMLLGAGLLLTACGPSTGSTSTGASPNAGGDAGGAGNEAGGAGAEAAGVRYQNARFHYRVDAPGTMQEAADGSASTQRGVERLSISVVSGAGVSDPRAYATGDLGQVAGSSAKYHQMQALGPITISGRASLKTVYSWTDGTNPVTGKPNDLITARYYIPKDSSTLAVVTYSIAANQYDPQGADDVASTFAWL